MTRLALLLLLCAHTPLLADDVWAPMSGDEIRAALTDRKLKYPSGWQQFNASGRTLYNAGRDSWGYWSVRGEQYCSMWPPSDIWACYEVQRAGQKLRFVGSHGDVTQGVYADE